MAGGIFISYRRDDSRHAAGRLVDRLGQSFHKSQLFMDVDAIEPGLDFVRVLGQRVAQCDVMLVVMGPQWIDFRDQSGRRRLEDPHDFVRLEIEHALRRDIRIIPVLVDGAPLPRPAQLPPSLQPLVNRQATRLQHERFGQDVERLAETLNGIIRPRRWWWAGSSGSPPVAAPRGAATVAANVPERPSDTSIDKRALVVAIALVSILALLSLYWASLDPPVVDVVKPDLPPAPGSGSAVGGNSYGVGAAKPQVPKANPGDKTDTNRPGKS